MDPQFLLTYLLAHTSARQDQTEAEEVLQRLTHACLTALTTCIIATNAYSGILPVDCDWSFSLQLSSGSFKTTRAYDLDVPTDRQGIPFYSDPSSLPTLYIFSYFWLVVVGFCKCLK